MTNPLRIARFTAAAALATAGFACAHAPASNATPSYTVAQAEAGETAYQAACVACHQSDLSGGGAGPALAGPSFGPRWDGRPVGQLTAFMREHMPRTVPGVLNDRTYLAAASYLLAKNGVPTSDTELTLESTWRIRIAPR